MCVTLSLMGIMPVWEFIQKNYEGMIAIAALAFTAYQAYLTRQHNRVSIAPSLTTFHDEVSENGQLILVTTLRNSGLGPARIKKFEFYLDGILWAENYVPNLSNRIVELLPSDIGEAIVYASSLNINHILPAESELVLVRFTADETNIAAFNVWKQLKARFELRVQYESLYGDKIEIYSTKSSHTA